MGRFGAKNSSSLIVALSLDNLTLRDGFDGWIDGEFIEFVNHFLENRIASLVAIDRD